MAALKTNKYTSVAKSLCNTILLDVSQVISYSRLSVITLNKLYASLLHCAIPTPPYKTPLILSEEARYATLYGCAIIKYFLPTEQLEISFTSMKNSLSIIIV